MPKKNIPLGHTFGTRMRFARRAQEMSQAELARRTGMGLSTIHQYESLMRDPPLTYALKIAKVLGITVDESRPVTSQSVTSGDIEVIWKKGDARGPETTQSVTYTPNGWPVDG